MTIETWKFVQEKSKQAMKQVHGIKDEAARLRVTPPLAVAPLAHGEDMRWDPTERQHLNIETRNLKRSMFDNGPIWNMYVNVEYRISGHQLMVDILDMAP